MKINEILTRNFTPQETFLYEYNSFGSKVSTIEENASPELTYANNLTASSSLNKGLVPNAVERPTTISSFSASKTPQTSNSGRSIRINSQDEVLAFTDRTSSTVGYLVGSDITDFAPGIALVAQTPNTGVVLVNILGTTFGTGAYVFGGPGLYPITNLGRTLGGASNKWGAVYSANYFACPLPVVSDALSKLKTIQSKRLAPGKGHFGDDVDYVDIPDAPSEMKAKSKDFKGVISDDIEIVKTVGFLYSCVKELQLEVETLKKSKV